MMANSFSQVCDNWVDRENSKTEGEAFYKISWNYDLSTMDYKINMNKSKDQWDKNDIWAKAVVPDSEKLSPYIIEVTLNVLQAQLGLYDAYGIKI